MTVDDLNPGTTFGPSTWIEVTQRRVDAFADATDDHQWLHVDPERAAAGPYGGTIAHGWLSLALVAPVVFELLPLEDVALINYGADVVRFPDAVPTGTRVRGTLTVAERSPANGGTRIALDTRIEREGGAKPVCVARVLVRAVPA